MLLSPPAELFVVLVLQVSFYLKFYPVAGRIDVFVALYGQQHKKKFPVHATIQHSFSPSRLQAPAGHQSCPLGTKFLWLFLKLDNCGLWGFFVQEPNVIVLHLAKGSYREVIRILF